MKKYFFIIASALVFASCQESEVCQCLTESTTHLKENRMSGYKKTNSKPGPACEKVKDKFSNVKSESDKKKMETEMKACSCYKDYEKEMKLFVNHIMKPMEEMQENMEGAAGEELDKAMDEIEKELDKQ